MAIENLAKLSFFLVEKYHYSSKHTCDFRNIPRPHFCMGLLLRGTADFLPVNGETIHIQPGDIIFVPITSRYISKWSGAPDVLYISFHFAFEASCGISERQHFALQKLTLPNFDLITEKFSRCLDGYHADEASQMETLGIFFGILGQILPLLIHRNTRETDENIERAIKYIHLHSEKDISVAELAKISNMSSSNFYVRFKKYTSMTPIEYKNQVSIGRAVRLLKSEEPLSVEKISELLGFESATYFRRVFKKITGKTPLQFRKSDIEL